MNNRGLGDEFTSRNLSESDAILLNAVLNSYE